ncbi:MAG: hypothetical protein LBP67_08180 [Bacteroidales bacterium]|jgi:hypothetical protein|nr:hypothetical protein [Bacteroidales bacterium]
MTEHLISLLNNNNYLEAINYFLSLEEDESDEISEILAEEIVKDNSLIDKMIKLAVIDTDNNKVFDYIINNVSDALYDLYDEDEDENNIKDLIIILFRKLEKELAVFINADNSLYYNNMNDWFLKYGLIRYYFDDYKESIKIFESGIKFVKIKYNSYPFNSDDYAMIMLFLLHYYLGLVYSNDDNKIKSLEHYSIYLLMCQTSNDIDIEKLADIYLKISDVCSEDNREQYLLKSIHYYSEAIQRELENSGPEDLLDAYEKIIEYYDEKDNYSEKYFYLQKHCELSEKYFKENDSDIDAIEKYMDSINAIIFFIVFDLDNAKEMLVEDKMLSSKEITIQNIVDEVLLKEMQTKAKNVFDEYEEEEVNSAYAYSNYLIGTYYKYEEDRKNTEKFLGISEDLYKKLIDDTEDQDYYDNLYDVYENYRDFYQNIDQEKHALKYLDKMIQLRLDLYDENPDDEDAKDNLANAYYDASEFCDLIGKDKLGQKYMIEFENYSE